MPTTATAPGDWKFRVLHREARPRRLIVEGHVSPPYERPYHDELFFYAVMGLDYLSLEVSRDFDGERLLDYLFLQLGAPEEPPRIQVGGRQDEEEGALLLVEWRFPAGGRQAMLRRLEEIMGQSLADDAPNRQPDQEEQ
jgi:hypothetical protein